MRVAGVPNVGTVEETMYLARGSDGSYAEGPVDSGSFRTRNVIIISQGMGVSMRVSDALRMKSTRYEPKPPSLSATSTTSAQEQCAGDQRPRERYSGAETILGLRAFHYVSDVDSSSWGVKNTTSITADVWHLQELNCVAIQQKAVYKNGSGAVIGGNERGLNYLWGTGCVALLRRSELHRG
jgi:hypothetical protein